MIRGEMVVRETGYSLEMVRIGGTEQLDHLEGISRVPDIINDLLESRHVVGEGQLVGGAVEMDVGRAHAEGVGDAVAREVAVLVGSKVGVLGRDAAHGQELIHRRFLRRVVVAAHEQGDVRVGAVFLGRAGLGHLGFRNVAFDRHGLWDLDAALVLEWLPADVLLGVLGDVLHKDRRLDELDVG